MTENSGDSWLKHWVFNSLQLQLQLPEPVARHQQLRLLSKITPSKPFIIGISGAQGSGKSTLAARLQQLWCSYGIQTDILSLDDYYLEPVERLKRAKLWHPLFAERGVPGTHDTELLLSQLYGFRRGDRQCWRRYDKGLDRVSHCSEQSYARLLILEGWCVGLKAQPENELIQALNALEQQQDPNGLWRQQVNQQLNGDYQQIWQQLDGLVWLNAPDWKAICRWRAWQEHALQLQGKGKSQAELEAFMLYFQRLTEQSWQQLPQRADFILTLDQDHNFIRLTPDE